MREERLDELLKEIREEEIPQEQIAPAKERVWKRLSGSASLACSEFRSQLNDYAMGRLTGSRRMLVGDHLSRCVECRRAIAQVTGERKVIAMPQVKPSRWMRWMRWAAAAAIVLAALYLGRYRLDSAFAPSGPRATVVSISDSLYRIPQTILQVGSPLMEGEVIRTPAGGRAILRIVDGSRIEMNERTELAVHAAWSGYTIQLARGDIIVQAAKQRRGRLKVRTRDSVSSVKGTIFSVSTGTAGSLVSVIEGSVAVSRAGSEEVLTQGGQAATSYPLQQVDIQEAISWSQDVEKYYTLLAEFIRIERHIAEMPDTDLRKETLLLPFIPAGTQAYFAIPNLDSAVLKALDLITQYANENAALNEWWVSVEGQRFQQTLYHIQTFTSLLGEEVVLVLVKDPGDSADQIPLMMARILPGCEIALREALDDVIGSSAERPYKIRQDLLLVSDNSSHLNRAAAQLGGGASSEFAAEIFDYYRSGVDWLAGIDVTSLAQRFQQSPLSLILGLSNLRYIFFEYGSGSSRDETEATFSFEGSRSGILSWLALPGAAGSSEYISTEAAIAFSASSRNPREAFDELLSIVGQNNDFAEKLREFESETGVRVGDDIASSLGTDFAFAVEHPSLPMPGWVVAFEALNPGTIDDAVRRLVDAYNLRLPPEKADSKLILAHEIVNGRSWVSLKSGISPATLYWTYDRGYLVASMDRALADRAIKVRDSGLPLVRSVGFQERFPTAAGLHNSGFFWFNTNSILADLASLIQSPALDKLIGSRDPILIIFDGGMEQIRVASRTRLTSLLLDIFLARGTIRQN